MRNPPTTTIADRPADALRLQPFALRLAEAPGPTDAPTTRQPEPSETGGDWDDDWDQSLDPDPNGPIPWDDVGLDFDDEEPEPQRGDFWPQHDDEEDALRRDPDKSASRRDANVLVEASLA